MVCRVIPVGRVSVENGKCFVKKLAVTGEARRGTRFIVAMDAPGARKLLLFDRETQKWSELMSNKNPGLNWNEWSDDSKFVYVSDFVDRHAPVVYRIRIADRKIERVAAFEVPQGMTGYWIGWVGVAPDGSPLVLRDLSIEEIYALDVDLP